MVLCKNFFASILKVILSKESNKINEIITFFQCMMRHFKTIPVVEKEALTYFIYMVKTNKSKLDNRHGMDQNHRSIDSMDRD